MTLAPCCSGSAGLCLILVSVRYSPARVTALKKNMTLPSIGLIGRARSGKDTIAAYLMREHGYVRVGFADAVKDAALALDPIVTITPYADEGHKGGTWRLSDLVHVFGWEMAKDEYPEVRRILQRLGDEAGRQIHGENTWVDQARYKIRAAWIQGSPVVVSDVRYPNEADLLREAGLTLVKVERCTIVGQSVTDSHASEAFVDTLSPDVVISNDGTIKDLETQVRAVVSR